MASANGDSVVYYMGSTTQTLNLTEATVTLDTTAQIDTDTFSVSNGVITVKEAGTYLVINHLAVDRDTTGANRTSGESFLHVNNTLVAGCYTDGYIRRNGSSDEFSDCAYGIYEFAANDEVEMRQLRINQAGSNGRIVGNVTTYMDGKTSLTIIKLNDDNAKIILEATSAQNQTLTADNGVVEMNYDDEVVKDSGFTHSEVTNPDNITLDSAGKYLAVYSNSWDRGTDTTSKVRTGCYEWLALDGTIIPGSYHNNYIRGSQSSEQIMRGNNSAMVLFETTSANQVLTHRAAREDGDLTLTRHPLKSRLVVYKLNGSEKTFRIESSSTENIGSTTEATMTYDSSDWADTGYSLASNQITVTDGSKFLIMQGVKADAGTGVDRSGNYQFGRFDGVNNKYGTCTKYRRDTGGMNMTCPHWGSIETILDSETIECRMDNLFTNSTIMYRDANTGAFCGIDLDTLGSAEHHEGTVSISLGIQQSETKEKGGKGSSTESITIQQTLTKQKGGLGDILESLGVQDSVSGGKSLEADVAISLGVQQSSKGAKSTDTLIYANTLDDGTYTNWTGYQGTLSDGNPGAKITSTGANLSTIMYKAQTVSDANFPLEVILEYEGIREVELFVRFFDATLSNTLTAPMDTLQINGKNSFRFIKDDFTVGGTMDWDDVAYISVGANPYPGETVEFTLLSIRGGVSFKPAVVFGFDDGHVSVIDTVKPILDAKGFKGTAYVVPDWLGINDNVFMTLSEVQTLHTAGWDIGNHGYESLDPTSLTVQQIQDDYEDFIDWADTNNVTGAEYHMAYPDGITTDNTDTAANNAGLLSGRTILTGENTRYGNQLYLYQLMLGSTSTFNDFLTAYIHAIHTSSVLQVTIHAVVTTPVESYEVATSVFQEIVNFCDNNNVDVQTITEYYAVTHRDASITESLTVQQAAAGDKASFEAVNLSLTIQQVLNKKKGGLGSVALSIGIQMNVTYIADKIIHKYGSAAVSTKIQELTTGTKQGRAPPLTISTTLQDTITGMKHAEGAVSISLGVQQSAIGKHSGTGSVVISHTIQETAAGLKAGEGTVLISQGIQQSTNAFKGASGNVLISTGVQESIAAYKSGRSAASISTGIQISATGDGTQHGSGSASVSHKIQENITGTKHAEGSVSISVGAQVHAVGTAKAAGIVSIHTVVQQTAAGTKGAQGSVVDSNAPQLNVVGEKQVGEAASESLKIQDTASGIKNAQGSVVISVGIQEYVEGSTEAGGSVAISLEIQQSASGVKAAKGSGAGSTTVQQSSSGQKGAQKEIVESLSPQISATGTKRAQGEVSISLSTTVTATGGTAAGGSVNISHKAQESVSGQKNAEGNVAISLGIQESVVGSARKIGQANITETIQQSSNGTKGGQGEVADSTIIEQRTVGEKGGEGSASISHVVTVEAEGRAGTLDHVRVLDTADAEYSPDDEADAEYETDDIGEQVYDVIDDGEVIYNAKDEGDIVYNVKDEGVIIIDQH